MSTRPLRVHIIGDEGIPSAISEDFDRLQQAVIASKSLCLVRWPWKADVIHCVWWNRLLSRRYFWRNWLRTPLVATASNFIDLDAPDYSDARSFARLKSRVTLWIAPSSKQQRIFKAHGLRCIRLPFFIDTSRFNSSLRQQDRRMLAARLGIDWQKLEGKVILGSFQRDSLGSDLTKPKWQKDPELLLTLVKHLPRESFVLLLAGPRRHYIIARCKAEGIPYIYVGKETAEDDVLINMISQLEMPLLYAMIDCYLVTSASEGGPKAVLEGLACGTTVLSTDVGLSEDYLEPSHIFRRPVEYERALREIVKAGPTLTVRRTENTIRLLEEMTPSAYQARLENIYHEAASQV